MDAADNGGRRSSVAESGSGMVDAEDALSDLQSSSKLGSLSILVGSLASASAGLDVWQKLGNFLQREVGKKVTRSDQVLQWASIYVDDQYKELLDRSAAKARLISLVEQMIYSSEPLEARPYGAIYPTLCDLPVRDFFTTNWDSLFYRCLIRHAEGSDGSPARFDHQTLSRHLAPAPEGQRHLVHLHGTIPGDLDQTIVTSDECYQFESLAPAAFERLVRQFNSGGSMLVVGARPAELDALVYLAGARTRAGGESRLYALLPALDPRVAEELWRDHGIRSISPEAPGASPETVTLAFLEALGGAVRGEAARITVRRDEAGSTPGSAAEEADSVDDILQRVEDHMLTMGFHDPADYFLAWPGRDELKPRRPPTHALLDTVYVERGLKSRLIADLEQGRQAGISGLLGIGGVGKSFLAMKIAQELLAKDWSVVWVGLLDQNAEDALTQLAAAFRLDFAENLRIEEKIVALKILFEELARTDRRTLVILDNAERFPALPLLLKALEHVPILITSRTEECNDIVRYRRIESMSEEQAEELCRLFLDQYGDNFFSRSLEEADRRDLRKLCRHLGGHPLGIRLVLAGFIRRLAHRRSGPRPFRRILEEITTRGLAAIPPASEVAGRAGEPLHRTIFTTFEWPYRDLPRISPQAGLAAKQLLPVIAALGAVAIAKSSILAALKFLVWRIEEALDPSIALARQQQQFQQAASTEQQKTSSLTVGSFGIRRLSTPAPRLELPEHSLAFDEEEFLTLLGGSISLTPLEKKRIIEAVPRLSQYQVDQLILILKEERRKFNDLDVRHLPQLRALEEKHAAEWEALGQEIKESEKDRASPTLRSQPAQPVRQAKTTATVGEVEEEGAESGTEGDGRNQLADEQSGEETAQVPLGEILEPHPPAELVPRAPGAPARSAPREPTPWFSALKGLLEESPLEEALDVLLSVSLVEAAEDDEAVSVHPLVREFAFEERARADGTPGDSSSADSASGHERLTASGPSLEVIYESALSVLSPSPDHGDSLLDLLPRLHRRRSLAEQACRKILDNRSTLKASGDWQLLAQLLGGARELAHDSGLHEFEGLILCVLGELLDRMEYHEGLTMLPRGIELLEQHGGPSSRHQLLWTKSYLAGDGCETQALPHLVGVCESIRAASCRVESESYFDAQKYIESHLSRHQAEGAEGLQVGLYCGGDNWLSNVVIDLSGWFETFFDREPSGPHLRRFEDLVERALAEAESGATRGRSITSESRIYRQLELLIARHACGLIDDEALESGFGELRDEARRSGIRGLGMQRMLDEHLWASSVLDQRWQAASSAAERLLTSRRAELRGNKTYWLLKPRLFLAVSQLLQEDAAEDIERIGAELASIEERAREWGRNDLLGWLLLAQALFDTRREPPEDRSAVRRLVQAREAFRRRRGSVLPEAEAVHRRTLELVDRRRLQSEKLRDSLTAEEREAPDFRPWLLQRRFPLPERVRCKTDGRTMRLVRGGLQLGPFGRETWLYPFYCDEEPVRVGEFETFLESAGRRGFRFSLPAEDGPWVTGMDHPSAQAYATWAGKRLPNSHEWFAIKWQIAAGHRPESWPDWATASERMLARIETAISGRVWDEQPLLPGQTRNLPLDVPEPWLSVEISGLLSGAWLSQHQRLEDAWRSVSAEVWAEIAEGTAGRPSRDHVERLVERLAAAPSLSLEEKIQILTKRDLSKDEIGQLLEALIEDVRKLSGRHAYGRTVAAKSAFVEWLLYRTPRLTADELRRVFAADWLRSSPEIEHLFEQKVLGPIATTDYGLTSLEKEEMARGLASSLAVQLEEKTRILSTLDRLSAYQLREISSMLRAEREKLLTAIEQQPGHVVSAALRRSTNAFIDWLLTSEDRTPYTGRSRVAGIWSGMQSPSQAPAAFTENPFNDRLWACQGRLPPVAMDRREIGIRCVLPLFVAGDLDQVEPL